MGAFAHSLSERIIGTNIDQTEEILQGLYFFWRFQRLQGYMLMVLFLVEEARFPGYKTSCNNNKIWFDIMGALFLNDLDNLLRQTPDPF